jgi:hypothetical protein
MTHSFGLSKKAEFRLEFFFKLKSFIHRQTRGDECPNFSAISNIGNQLLKLTN